MEEVVEEVAIFKKPSSGGGNGKYELKDKYYAQYCPFFYHYSKAEQSKVILLNVHLVIPNILALGKMLT